MLAIVLEYLAILNLFYMIEGTLSGDSEVTLAGQGATKIKKLVSTTV